ncbi:VirB3 family type IV secretion system protein [Burkholderia cenocepacia]|uniref:VirB3 family type IV secretion system protein n=1 Tax=Burkholderia cenocepacia TaxID=95486 RepID=UPI002B241C4C|nr:VirB3 family type IV secretion system protein [Burkholderia cenocepacia]MEB2558776.1 VirB3 family type IV secretion system protein [Burkholderia cenocepacia]
MEEEKTLYPSYAGLNRVAMIGRVPMFPALIIGCTSLFASMIGGFVLGPGGLLIGSAGVPIFLFLRHVCVTDDQALRLFWLEFRCWLDRRRVAVFGKTYTLAPMRYGRDLGVYTRSFARGRDLERFAALRQRLLTRAEEDNDE